MLECSGWLQSDDLGRAKWNMLTFHSCYDCFAWSKWDDGPGVMEMLICSWVLKSKQVEQVDLHWFCTSSICLNPRKGRRQTGTPWRTHQEFFQSSGPGADHINSELADFKSASVVTVWSSVKWNMKRRDQEKIQLSTYPLIHHLSAFAEQLMAVL